MSVLAGVILVAAMMYAPSSPVGPGFLEGARVDAGVHGILERCCRDCHSSETRYPWYAALPVVSRWIREDVEVGRRQLNLSEWAQYSRIRKMRALTGIANQVKDRAMPPGNYLVLHPSARLSEAEVAAVFAWCQAERLRLINESETRPDVVE